MDFKNWLCKLPCVKDGRVKVDVRGSWPVMIINRVLARRVQNRDDVINFVLQYVD